MLNCTVLLLIVLLSGAAALDCFKGKGSAVAKTEDFDYCTSVYYADGHTAFFFGSMGQIAGRADSAAWEMREWCHTEVSESNRQLYVCNCAKELCNAPVAYDDFIVSHFSEPRRIQMKL